MARAARRHRLRDATNEGGEWRFALPAGHAAVLLDPDALDGVAGTVLSLVAHLTQVPRLVESFRTGLGIPYADYGPDEAEGQALGTRPVYRSEIATWLAAVPDLIERLAPYARGCWTSAGRRLVERLHGAGPSRPAGGRRRPRPRLDRRGPLVAEAEGVADRVRFELRDAATLAGAGYDPATMFETLHDLARPVEALRAAREALDPDGVVLVADEPSVTPSPGRPATRSGATTATACCTACPRA